MIRKRNMTIFAICSVLLLSACSVKVVVPEIEYPSYEDLEAKEPNCGPVLDTMEADPTEDNALEVIYCYAQRTGFWRGQWILLDEQIKSIKQKE